MRILLLSQYQSELSSLRRLANYLLVVYNIPTIIYQLLEYYN
jgi:hypothetical protein